MIDPEERRGLRTDKPGSRVVSLCPQDDCGMVCIAAIGENLRAWPGQDRGSDTHEEERLD
jgi:hypothetical protein